MGILKRIAVAGPIGTVLVLIQCSTELPVAVESGTCAFTITAAATVVRPDELNIHLVDKTGKAQTRTVNQAPDNGSVFFEKIPCGPIVVDMVGRTQGIRTMYGHGEAEIATPHALLKVPVRGIVAAKNLDPAKEALFLQNTVGRSTLWDAFAGECVFNSAAVDGRASLRTSIGASTRFLYFLFEVSDNSLLNDDRPAGTAGELTSDAVIMYVGTIAPHALYSAKQPFPAARFQCGIAKTIPENGQFNFVNYATGATRNGVVRDLVDEDFKARILSLGPTTRLLELRVRKGVLAFPEGIPAESRQYGLVVRYRNNFDPMQPAQLIDWQTGLGDNDPRNADASWGYLELNP